MSKAVVFSCVLHKVAMVRPLVDHRVKFAKIEKKVDEAKTESDKVVEDVCRFVKGNKKGLSDVFKAPNAVAVDLLGSVAAHGEFSLEAIGMRTLDRQFVQDKQNARVVEHDSIKDYKCLRCGEVSWMQMAEMRSFLCTLNQSTAELYESLYASYGIWQCSNAATLTYRLLLKLA